MPLACISIIFSLVFNSDDYTGTFKNLTFNDQGGRNPVTLQLIYKVYEVTRYLLYPCLLMAASASAQNTMTSSPYSMFGLGEMASGLYGQNTSMAGVTVGMREGMLMNIENPAGLTALDSCKLFAEASAFREE